MTSKQLVNQLYNKLHTSLNYTDEQVDLIMKLHQAFETAEEKTLRIAKFREVVAKVQHSKI